MYKVPSVVIPLHKEYRLAVPGYQSFAGILEQFRPDILHINSPCTLGFGAVKYAKHFDVPGLRHTIHISRRTRVILTLQSLKTLCGG